MATNSIKSLLLKSWDTATYTGVPVVMFGMLSKNFPNQIAFTLTDMLIFLVVYWLIGIWIGNYVGKLKRYSNSSMKFPIPLWRALFVSVGFILVPFFPFLGQCIVFLLWAVFACVYPIIKLFHIRQNTDKFADRSPEVKLCYRELLLGIEILILILVAFIFY